MTHRWTRFLALAFVPCAVACIDDFDNVGDGQFGSGPDCASICEEASECEGSGSVSDCREQCEEIERLVERAGCADDFDDFMDCAEDVPDLCNVGESECAAEVEAYTECILAHCDDYPEDCEALSD